MAGDTETFMDPVFPVASNMSSTKYNLIQKELAHKSHKLEKGDLQDLKVPIQVCIDYSAVLRPSKYRLREVVMNAMGIHTSHRNASVSYEEFLKMNSFIKYNTGTPDDYTWFCVKLFDPRLQGFSSVKNCEAVIDLLFENQDEDGNTTKSP